MLDISVSIEGDKVVLNKLSAAMQLVPEAVDRGLQRAAKGIYAEAFKWLSGPSSGFHYVARDEKKGGHSSGWRKQYDNAGSYPVPVRMGNLRRLLDWLGPNESKSGAVGTITAHRHEVIIYDSAAYARPIFLGLGSSSKYGPRNALRDGLSRFNAGGGIKNAVEDEIRKDLSKFRR